MSDVYREACFLPKMFPNGLNIGSLLRARIEKTVYGIETHQLSGKEKVLEAAVSKKGHADSLLGDDFPEKKCDCKLLPITNSLGKIHLIYWMALIYIYIYIYSFWGGND